MKILEQLKQSRELILVAFFFADIILSFILYFEFSKYTSLFLFFEILLTIVVIAYAFFISKELHTVEYQKAFDEYIDKMTLQACFLINDKRRIKVIKDNINDIKFDLHTEKEIINILGHETWEHILSLDRKKRIATPLFEEETSAFVGDTIRYFRYIVQYNVKTNFGKKGILLWFEDITKLKLYYNRLHDLLHKYRLIAFELETVFATLPFAIFKRNAKNQIIYCNNAYSKLLALLNHSPSNTNSIPELFSINDLERMKSESRLPKKVFIINDRPATFLIEELVGDAMDGSIGFLMNINEFEHSERAILSLEKTIINLLSLSSNALLIIDTYGNVARYNNLFIELFNIDQQWLDTKPSYSSLLDKMREKGKLPEMKDYKEYKSLRMQNIMEAIDEEIYDMHLPDGVLIRVNVIPSQTGETIFSYDNLTEKTTIENVVHEKWDVVDHLISKLPQGMAIVGQDGKLYHYNKSFAMIFNLDENMLKRRPHFSELIPYQKDIISQYDFVEKYKQAIIDALENRKESVLTGIIENLSTKGSEGFKASLDTMIITPLPDNTVSITLTSFAEI